MSENINTPLEKIARKVRSIYSTLISTDRRDLLWTNPNPASSFAARTIDLDLSGYYAIEVEYKFECSVGFATDAVAASVGNVGSLKDVWNTNRYREFYTSNSGVTFNSAYYWSAYSSGSPVSDNTSCIPYKIYGIRKVIGGNANDIRDEFPRYNLDTTAASGTDHDLYAAITALGWTDVIE